MIQGTPEGYLEEYNKEKQKTIKKRISNHTKLPEESISNHGKLSEYRIQETQENYQIMNK